MKRWPAGAPDRDASEEERYRLLDQLVRHRKRHRSLDAPARTNRDEGSLLPLTFAQEALWFVDQLEPKEALHNVPCAVRLEGELDVEALRASLDVIVERHEPLRTTFHLEAGKPRQRVHPPSAGVLAIVDLDRLPEPERLPEAVRRATAEAHRAFDLTAGPLFRATLLRLGEGQHVLLLNFHHLITDGWSMGVLTDELRQLYGGLRSGRSVRLAELDFQMADFALWQRRTHTETSLERQLDYWRRHLHDLPVFELPTDRPRPAIPSFRGDHQELRLDGALSDSLRSLAKRSDVTLFVLLATLFKILLRHATGQTDVVVGSAIAHRNRVELEGLIGFLVNMLVLRSDLSGDPPLDRLLAQLRDTTLGALTHQEVPLNRIVQDVQPRRDPGRTPLFQIEFSLLTPDRNPAVYGYGLGSGIAQTLELPGLVASSLPIDYENARYDLAVFLWDLPRGISGSFEYRRDLFERKTIAKLAGRFESLLRHVTESPRAHLSSLLAYLDRVVGDERRADVELYEEALTRGLRELGRADARKAEETK